MSVRRFERFDLSNIAKPLRLDNGWLKTDAVLTRTGVFEYRTPSGDIRRELRPPEEVFHVDALASFELNPVTIDHPPVGVMTSKNTKQFQRGSVSHVRKDGANVRADIMITDDEAIHQAENGRKQISCGYTCDCEETPGITRGIPGVLDGQRYDAVQRNIRGNHVALVYKGRAGENAALRLDAGDAELVDAMRKDSEMDPKHIAAAMHAFNSHVSEGDEHDHDAAHGKAKAAAMVAGAEEDSAHEVADHVSAIHKADCSGTRNDSKEKNDMKKIKLDGLDFEVSELAAQAIEKFTAQHNADLAAAKAEVSKQTARADKAEEDLAVAKKLDVPSLVAARLTVVRSAEKLLPAKHGLKLDSMSDIEIKKAAILAKSPSAKEKLATADEGYVNARFDAAIEGLSDEPNVGLQGARAAGQRLDGVGGEEIDLDARREAMAKEAGSRHVRK